jgi:hypothetical protein
LIAKYFQKKSTFDLRARAGLSMFCGMLDPAKLSPSQLLDLLAEQARELATHKQELAQSRDIIRQLEAQNLQLQKDYLQLWRDRFEAKSERYIADPDQLRIDFGDTDDAADAAEGLAEAIAEAGLIPAHLRHSADRDQHPGHPAVRDRAGQDLHRSGSALHLCQREVPRRQPSSIREEGLPFPGLQTIPAMG